MSGAAGQPIGPALAPGMLPGTGTEEGCGCRGAVGRLCESKPASIIFILHRRSEELIALCTAEVKGSQHRACSFLK